MIDPTLNQQTLDYLEKFGPASLPDKALPSPIREMMVSNGAQTVARIKVSEGRWELVFLSAMDVQVAQGTGIDIQSFAEIKAR
jgi:hypothetical protein